MATPRTREFTKALLLSRALLDGECAAGVLDDLLDTAVRLADAESGFIVLVDAKGEHVIRAARDAGGRTIAQPRTSRSLVAQAIATRGAVIAGEAPLAFARDASPRELRIRSMIAAPLLVQGRVLGALVVHGWPLAEV